MIRRALISVSDKTGIAEFARGLRKRNIDIIATGGTAEVLREAGIMVRAMEEVTRFPECFSGRVKTMHPLIMGGILYERGNAQHETQAKQLAIEPIDLVAVNLYSFERGTGEIGEHGLPGRAEYGHLARGRRQAGETGETRERELIEFIDVGGSMLLRAAAKNHAHVTAVCDPGDYDRVLTQVLKRGETTPELRRELAAKVFTKTAQYDSAIMEHFSEGRSRGVFLENGQKLRYGENPHQWGRFYSVCGASAAQHDASLFHMYQGKELSYLNILDADAASALAGEFEEPTAVFVKHANPSGVASHEDIAEAFQRAYDADRLSAFGVIVALNRRCTEMIVRKIIDQKIFAEVIVAPGYDEPALELFWKRPKLRVLRINPNPHSPSHSYRSAFGGMLVQNEDKSVVTETDLTCVTERKPTPEQVTDLLFAWKVVKHSKSNAIVFAKDKVTVGIGTGQTSRVDATWIAARRALARARGSVMASDAFFPFPDSVEEAAKHGIAAIIQPGGSIRDAEVFAKAEELGIAMMITGIRAFRH